MCTGREARRRPMWLTQQQWHRSCRGLHAERRLLGGAKVQGEEPVAWVQRLGYREQTWYSVSPVLSSPRTAGSCGALPVPRQRTSQTRHLAYGGREL
jgi:hypothetical protein